MAAESSGAKLYNPLSSQVCGIGERRGHGLRRQRRVGDEDVGNRSAGGEFVENRGNEDTSAGEARLTVADSRVNDDLLLPVHAQSLPFLLD